MAEQGFCCFSVKAKALDPLLIELMSKEPAESDRYKRLFRAFFFTRPGKALFLLACYQALGGPDCDLRAAAALWLVELYPDEARNVAIRQPDREKLRLRLQFFRGSQPTLIRVKRQEFPRVQMQGRRHVQHIEAAVACNGRVPLGKVEVNWIVLRRNAELKRSCLPLEPVYESSERRKVSCKSPSVSFHECRSALWTYRP